jgi:hypothetical protein
VLQTAKRSQIHAIKATAREQSQQLAPVRICQGVVNTKACSARCLVPHRRMLLIVLCQRPSKVMVAGRCQGAMRVAALQSINTRTDEQHCHTCKYVTIYGFL